MTLFERVLDRPLPVFLAAGLVVLLGIWSLSTLPVNRNPSVQIPMSLVVVQLPGATPDEVESEVTIELEEQLTALEGLRQLRSVSSEGVSSHVLEFEDRVDMTESLRDVQDKVELATTVLPQGAERPIVQEVSFDEQPIIFFTLRGGNRLDLYQLRDVAEGLKPQFESVPGVSRVEIFGGYEREVQVLADPIELAAYGLTLQDLGAALQRQGQSAAGGKVRGGTGEWLIRPNSEYRNLEEIRATVVRRESSGALTIGDVARVELSHERPRSGAWFDGEPSITLIVRPRANINTIETVDRLTQRADELRTRLPSGVSIQATSDGSEDIEAMLQQLGTSAGLGVLLVFVVLLVMFGPGQALLVASALPFSLLFTFIGLAVFGMEISNIALFSLILVLGLVVDGAIVVGEAIFAEREAGARSRVAAKVGVERVGLPVISADLTTVAAFLPMLLMVGVMGQFMSVMPKVVAFALVGSVFVDHLLLPAAVAKLGLRRRRPRKWLAPDGLPWFSPELPRMKRLYMNTLGAALRNRSLVLGIAAACLAGAFLLFTTGGIDSIFLPKTDRGRFTLNYALPLGTSLAETSRVGLLIADEVEEIAEVDRCVLTTGETGALNAESSEGGRTGPEYGRLTVELVDPAQRTRSQGEVVEGLRTQIAHFAGVTIDLEELSEGPPTGAALAVRIKGQDLDALASVATDIEERIRLLKGAEDVRADYHRGKPEVRVDVDRVVAGDRFGVTTEEVWRAFGLAFQGQKIARMWLGSERVDIRVEASGGFTQSVEQVRELPIRSEDGQLIPLGEIAEVSLGFSHDSIFRHDARRAITVRANVAPGGSSVALEADARAAISALSLPTGVQVEFGGESEERERSYASLWEALRWGLLLIYIIIAIQFDSLRQPFIVILGIPLALVGVALGLVATATPFSFIVFIGAVSLTGIVVNSGIVLVDAINQNRREGMPLRNAICDGALGRLRPVLLTTLTTAAGLLPLTLNVAEGGEFWAPLGLTIISGLFASTGLTLIVVPVLYSLLEEPPRWGGARLPHVEQAVAAVQARPGA